MEVVRLGKAYSAEVECTGNGNGGGGCGALLRVSREDLRFYEGVDYPWRSTVDAVVMKCPLCFQMTDLPKAAWPQNARSLEAWTNAWRDDKPEGAA